MHKLLQLFCIFRGTFYTILTLYKRFVIDNQYYFFQCNAQKFGYKFFIVDHQNIKFILDISTSIILSHFITIKYICELIIINLLYFIIYQYLSMKQVGSQVVVLSKAQKSRTSPSSLPQLLRAPTRLWIPPRPTDDP